MNIEFEYLDKCALFINRLRDDVFQTYKNIDAEDYIYEHIGYRGQNMWDLMIENDNGRLQERDIIDTFSLVSFFINSDYLRIKGLENTPFCAALSTICTCRNKIAHRNPDISYSYVCETMHNLVFLNELLGFKDLVTPNYFVTYDDICQYNPTDANFIAQSQVRTMIILLIEQIQITFRNLIIQHDRIENEEELPMGNIDRRIAERNRSIRFLSKFNFDNLFGVQFENMVYKYLPRREFDDYLDLCADERKIMNIRNAVFHSRTEDNIDFHWAENWLISMGDALHIDINHLIKELYWHRDDPGYNVI